MDTTRTTTTAMAMSLRRRHKTWFIRRPILLVLVCGHVFETAIWWACILSPFWKEGPFPQFQTNPREIWESFVYFGPLVTCRRAIVYNAYLAWEDDPPAWQNRFSSATFCWPTAKYVTALPPYNYLTIGLLLSSFLVLVLTILVSMAWFMLVVKRRYTNTIRRKVLPALKCIQVVFCFVLILCIEIMTGNATIYWTYFIAMVNLVLMTALIVLQLTVSCCGEKLKLVSRDIK
eukprot:sb/3469397/